MVNLHINNTKHITIANIYIPPQDTTSTHYNTADTDIQHCIQYITNIPHSVLANPGPTTLNKRVWICDICHKQIHVRKQISIRCNRIEHWVHLRCAGIRQAQYTDTWPCHLHRESRLTPHISHRHNTTPPLPTLVQAPYPLPTYTTHTTATKTPTHVQHSPCPHRIVKAQTQFSHPLTPLSTHTAPSQTHTHVTYSTNTSHYTYLKHVTCTRQNT